MTFRSGLGPHRRVRQIAFVVPDAIEWILFLDK